MLTFAWGPAAWDTMLTAAFAYPKIGPTVEKQKSMTAFLIGMCKNLPCPGCKVHASTYCKLNPPDVSSQEKLAKWIVTFHNAVNKRSSNGKKRSDWTVEEAKASLIKRRFGDQQGLVRANQVREEDHQEIQKLRQYVRLLEADTNRPPLEFTKSGKEVFLLDQGFDLQSVKLDPNAGNPIETTSPEIIALLTMSAVTLFIVLVVAIVMLVKKHKGK